MEVLGSFVLFVFSFLATCAAQDTITVNQAIRDGETLVSTNDMYELGFFSPGRSRNRFLGIWYKNVSPQTVVWVANRETPITDSSGVFKVDTYGSLLVIAGTNDSVLWSSNTSIVSPTTIIPVAQLLSNGNLVVRENGEEIFVWQSFDYPTDTILPGMKYGKDLVSGLNRQIVSWKSLEEPYPGQYVEFMDTDGFPQLIGYNGSVPLTRLGPWNGDTFSGLPKHVSNLITTHKFVFNDKEVYYMYKLVNNSVRARLYLSPEGNHLVMIWIEKLRKWSQYAKLNMDMCGRYGACGPYGLCNMDNSPVCSCMEGFEPRNPDKWSASQWSSGCRRRTHLDCGNGDGFQVIKNVKLPDTRRSWYNRSMTLDECATACKRNCSCAAYANIEITRGGSGCLMWFDDLMDVRTVAESQGLYVRVAISDLTIFQESTSKSSSIKRRQIIIAVASVLSSLVIGILLLAIMYAWSKKKGSLVETPDETVQTTNEEPIMEIHHDDTELSYFSLAEISKSTNDFSDDNKLGEGGFGRVYMGVLDDGREIAVKRLSKTSRQGLNEFKNELKFIAKLQHRNLVKLLGYCNQGDESMLIYEYMQNKSLDLFIFETNRSSILDWSQRFRIIHGIARGLLYLHQDSRLKVVHRDLKASNILLDADFNPKISDFGLARMFREHEDEANTNRVVGSLGYIAPEYAVDGTFSAKTDVFSFGVIVLEIVSGRKNRGFSHEKDSDNLLAHAWRLYEEGTALELFSEHAHASCVESEIMRSIHIGLLCVQHHAKDRPAMSSVILMFDQDGALPQPKKPAFFAKESVPRDISISVNGVTITTLEPR